MYRAGLLSFTHLIIRTKQVYFGWLIKKAKRVVLSEASSQAPPAGLFQKSLVEESQVPSFALTLYFYVLKTK